MTRSFRTRIARGAVVGGVTVAAVLGVAGVALAQQNAGGTVMPGNQLCTAQQWANTQVRGVLDTATGQGVKLKLYRGATVVVSSPGRVPGGSLQELPPTFSGPGFYQFCANNTGTAQSNIYGTGGLGTPGLHLYTDAEVN